MSSLQIEILSVLLAGVAVAALVLVLIGRRRSRPRAQLAASSGAGGASFTTHQRTVEADPDGAPWIKISRLDEMPPGLQPIRLNDGLREQLSQLTVALPQLVGAGMSAAGYRVFFTPEATAALHSGQLELMKSWPVSRPVAVEPGTGRIHEIAQMQRMAFQPAAAIAIGWQLLSAVTLQAFLRKFDRRVKNLELGIQKILHHLHNEQLGRVQGDVDYMQHLARSLRGTQLAIDQAIVYLGQLEAIERDCLQLSASLELERASLFIPDVAREASGTWRSFKRKAADLLFPEMRAAAQGIQETATRAHRVASVHLLTLYARALAAQLSSALNGSAPMVTGRIREIRALWQQQEASLAAVWQQLEERSAGLDAVRPQGVIDRARIASSQAIAAARSGVAALSGEIGPILTDLDEEHHRREHERQHGMEMVVRCDESGRALEAWRVLPELG